jgi:amidophosphoribosyltransferase
MLDKFKDECGVFGIFGHPEAANLTYLGLYSLQHRGQESAGICSADGEKMRISRAMGHVAEAFDEAAMESLPGHLAIGHTRYSTAGESKLLNAQPILIDCAHGQIAIAHNGNLVNAGELRAELAAGGTAFRGTTDTEVIAALIAAAAGDGLDAAVRRAAERMRGAFSIAVLTPQALYAVRDPHGIRPLALGDLDGSPVVASESCAFDIIGARFVRELEPGEILIVDRHGLRSERVELVGARPALDVFEFVYFARPDSRLYGKTIADCRIEMGRRLAREAPAAADLVIPVPESGVPAAIGYAQQSGIPYAEGLIKNRYVYRTFIQPDQHLRELGIRMKLNPVRSLIEGKRLVVVDDSIVRGNTIGGIAGMLREAGASEVHVRISSPPVVCPSFYGIDTPSRDELVAAGADVEEVRRAVGATTLSYLSLDGLQESIGLPAELFTREGFTCEYPIPVPGEPAMSKLRFERKAA